MAPWAGLGRLGLGRLGLGRLGLGGLGEMINFVHA